MQYRSGVLLGAWVAANLIAYRLVVRSGWPFGSEAPAEIRVDVFDSLPAWVAVGIVALSFVLPIAFVAAWRQVERRTGIDHQTVAGAWQWGFGAFTRPASVAVIAAIVALLLLPAFHEVLWFAAAPAALMVALLPFGVFDPRVAASPTGDGWWRVRWPGVRPLLEVVALLVVAGLADVLLSALAQAFPPMTPAVILGQTILGVITVALLASILLFRATPGRLRDSLSWKRLGPIAAVYARMMFTFAFFAVPIIVGAFLLWKLVPVHAAWAESRGALLPWSARALTALGSALETSGALVVTFIAGLPLCLMVARVVWLTSRSPIVPKT